MRKFLFCVCVILVLTSITMMIFQRDIEQALANKAESKINTEMPITAQENLNEPENPEDTAPLTQEEQQETDTETEPDYSQFCKPPHTKDGIGGAGGFIVDDPQCLELLARAIYAGLVGMTAATKPASWSEMSSSIGCDANGIQTQWKRC